MATSTARLGLYKPDDTGAENINVTTDLNNNLDNLDAKVGVLACTSAARPGSPYNGQMIRETDTGKVYVYDGSQWRQMLYHTASFDQTITMSAATQQVRIGGSTLSGSFTSKRALATDEVFSAQVTGDTQPRININADGTIDIGPGGVTAPDTFIYRDAAGVLGVTGLIADNHIVANGNIYTSGLEVSDGEILMGAAKKRPQLSTVLAVSNSTAETVVGAHTIPAGDAVIGAVYRVIARGLASVAAATTPTLRLRGRIGAAGGTGNIVFDSGAITFASGATNRPWAVDLLVGVISIGAGGTCRGITQMSHLLNNTTALPTSPTQLFDASTAAVGLDTTIARTLELTAQWSAANASNICTAYVNFIERVV